MLRWYAWSLRNNVGACERSLAVPTAATFLALLAPGSLSVQVLHVLTR